MTNRRIQSEELEKQYALIFIRFIKNGRNFIVFNSHSNIDMAIILYPTIQENSGVQK
jgi:hypothetical protein